MIYIVIIRGRVTETWNALFVQLIQGANCRQQLPLVVQLCTADPSQSACHDWTHVWMNSHTFNLVILQGISFKRILLQGKACFTLKFQWNEEYIFPVLILCPWVNCSFISLYDKYILKKNQYQSIFTLQKFIQSNVTLGE